MRHSCSSRPVPSSRNVLRSTPRNFLPYRLFGLMTSNILHTFYSVSESRGKGSDSFAANFSCEARLSREMPTICAPAL